MSIESAAVTPAIESSDTLNQGAAERAEAELLAGLLIGSDRAWREFHLRYDRLIYRCITKVTGRFSTIVSQDDIREIYATLIVQLLSNDMHKLRTFDAARGNRFSSWLGLLAINASYDYLRAIRREPNRAPLAEAEDLRCDLPTPHELCERRQRAERVVHALRHFSAKDQQFVELYFGEGLEPEQIAEKMNISVKTVYSKKHKIQSRLESLLAHAA
ncbi:MAG: sigma-70 family RNA polymerase sigma factor [Polyangiaceae bacterium]|nr:sigma-70 family RNA polymerase sigma factor [Polyangiaceae bacterium]